MVLGAEGRDLANNDHGILVARMLFCHNFKFDFEQPVSRYFEYSNLLAFLVKGFLT